VSDPSHEAIDPQLIQDLFEVLLRAYVEDGTLEIEGKTSAEIITEFYGMLTRRMSANAADFDLLVATDHRDDLLRHARAAADAGDDWIAATLYAISFEHLINAIITRAFERKNYGNDVVIPLIRELRLQTKVSALWVLAGLPILSEDHQKLLGQLIEFRNSFVHYKWVASQPDADAIRDRQVKAIVERAEELVTALSSIVAATFWDDRETEIITRLRNALQEGWSKEKATQKKTDDE